jgi:hypothetical protein
MSTSARDWMPRALVLAVLLALVAWVASCTEWVEAEVDRPLGRPARENPHYAAEQLLRHLGAKPQRQTGLERLPPVGSTLWLTARRWSLLPADDERLRAWVESGGHLVVFASARDDDAERLSWLPVRPWSRTSDDDEDGTADDADDTSEGDDDTEAVCTDDDDEPCPRAPDPNADTPDADEAADAPALPRDGPRLDAPPAGPLTEAPAASWQYAATARATSRPGGREGAEAKRCAWLTEPPGLAPAYGAPRRYQACTHSTTVREPLVQEDEAPQVLWALATQGQPAADVLRLAHGRGSVTVLADWTDRLFGNRQLTTADHGLVLVAALQARRGRTVWLVSEGARSALPRWLWDEAPAVVLLAALAIALGLWRGAVRFGPRIAAALPGRRSMAEQVRGTAAFLYRTGPQALLGAQMRALDECARQHLPRWAELGRGERADLLARATGLEAAALSSAFDRTLTRSPHALAATLQLLETARRRLRDAARDRSLVDRLRNRDPALPSPDSPLDETPRRR